MRTAPDSKPTAPRHPDLVAGSTAGSSRFSPASSRRALATCALLIDAGCATLPDAARETPSHHSQEVEFQGAHGPVSSGRSAAILTKLQGSSGDSDILQKHLALEQAINLNSPLVLGNRLLLLEDGPATYRAMFAAMRAARDHIHLETYIFEADDVGRRFAELLLEMHAAGVRINLIYDSVGCLNTPSEFFGRLGAAGIQLVEYNPVNPLAAGTTEWRLNNRDHRKLMVVDGRTAFIGGINISKTYSSGSAWRSARRAKAAPPAPGWRDTHLQIEGPVVAEFQKLFLNTWAAQNGPSLDGGNHFPPLERQGDEIVRAIGRVSKDPGSPIYLTLLSAIEHAERQVHITNAYFAPDPQFLKALADAAKRGVEVKLVLPSHTDSWAVFHAGRSHFAKLLRAGVGIYERRGTVMHSKTATIDGVWSTVGSTNLDWRSFLHNDEINASVLGRDFARQLEAMFARDLAESDAVLLERWEQRPLLMRLKERVARLVDYWL
jgi:cardiolipin synthase A/B